VARAAPSCYQRPAMIRASCHCGSICLEIEAAPTEVTECNCSVCHRYGVLWAYYTPTQVIIPSTNAITDTYRWDDESIAFHRCPRCGCVVYWAAVDPALDRMGVNARLMPRDVLAGARVRHLDGATTERYLD
jgi:hypothetical protein